MKHRPAGQRLQALAQRARKRQESRLWAAVASAGLLTTAAVLCTLIVSHLTGLLWWVVPLAGAGAGLYAACALELRRRRIAPTLREHIKTNLFDRGLLAVCLEHNAADHLPQLRPAAFWDRPLFAASPHSIEGRFSTVAVQYCHLCDELGLEPFPPAYEHLPPRLQINGLGGWRTAMLALTIVAPALLAIYHVMTIPLTMAWEEEVWLCLAHAAPTHL